MRITEMAQLVSPSVSSAANAARRPRRVLAGNGDHARIGVIFLGELREISMPLQCLGSSAS
jgi:hypothetical protein